jgi:toxin secretion/phage lysis holin
LESLYQIKHWLLAAFGILFSLLMEGLGGYDHFLRTLVVFMGVDILTGLLVATVFKASHKTETGRLSSRAGFRGLIKKCGMLMIVMVAVLLDQLMGTGAFTRDAVMIAFILNELISILENAGLMGIKMPKALCNALEVLKEKSKS